MIADGDELALVRWGLRFATPETEARYLVWHRDKAVPATRAATVLSLFSWAFGLGLMWLSVPERRVESSAWILLVCYPPILATAAAAYCRGLVRWMLPLTALANLSAGMVAVGLSYRMGLPALAMGGAALVSYFGFVILRLRPGMAALVTFPYIALNQVLVMRASLTAAEHVYLAQIPWFAFATGLVACAVVDRLARETYRQECIIEAQRRALEQERERADRLLHSILPMSVAERLKRGPEVIADRFDEVTVLFADIVGFTPMAAGQTPERLVEILNDIFTRFDSLAELHRVEKVKTIGDAYMAVAGVPEHHAEHALAAAELAFAMHAAVEDVSDRYGHSIALRIGLCTGPVVAGVIGSRKFAYDLWGDTVNTAARMESNGVVGQTQVPQSTYECLKDRYRFEDRGVIEVKGKGPMRTWLIGR